MEQLSLNFFGEEAKISSPKDLQSLRAKISEKYLFSPSDAQEIILYYIKDNKKVYIINGDDFSKFKEAKINTIFLDVNQNSKLYLDLKNESSENKKDENELKELLQKYEVFSKKKKEKEVYYYNRTNEIMNEIKKRRDELVRERHKEFSKVYEEDEEYITKIYNLQRKLNIPTTVRIPKKIKKEEEERILKEVKKKQEEIRERARKKIEAEKKEREERRKKYLEEVNKKIEEDKRKKEIAKFNLLKSTQKNINSRKEFFPYISLRKMEEEKQKAAFKARTIAAGTAKAFLKSKKLEFNKNKSNETLKLSNDILKESNKTNNEINTVPVFKKVNEILNKTVDQVKQVAIDQITKDKESKKVEDAKEKEKEKKAQIEKIKKITRDAVKEINNLTKLVIEQSNALIEKINNSEIDDFSSINNDENIILKGAKKEVKKRKREFILILFVMDVKLLLLEE